MSIATNMTASKGDLQTRIARIRSTTGKLKDLGAFAQAITPDHRLAQDLVQTVVRISNQAYPTNDMLAMYVILLQLKENLTPSLRRRNRDLPSVPERAVKVLFDEFGRTEREIAEILTLPESQVLSILRR